MHTQTICVTLCLLLFSGSLALAQQTIHPESQSIEAKTKAGVRNKAQKAYNPNNFGTLHEGAKKYGVDTSKPETLKGDVGGQIAKKTKL